MKYRKLLDVLWKRIIIGHLYFNDDNKEYIFKYDQEGVKNAKLNGFDYMVGFSDLDKEYVSKSLFPVLKSRIPPRNRHDIDRIMQELNISNYDEIDFLKKTNGKSVTDDYEMR